MLRFQRLTHDLKYQRVISFRLAGSLIESLQYTRRLSHSSNSRLHLTYSCLNLACTPLELMLALKKP